MKPSHSIFKTFFLSLCIIANTHFAYGQTASILPPAKTTFLDSNGKPLTSGTVDFYIPSTTTRKTTWQDAAETIPNTNPVVLDAAGRALILGSGSYRQVVKDRLNNVIWDQVTSSTGSGGGGGPTATGDGDLVGTIKPWAGMSAPNQYMFTYGQQVSRTTYSVLFTAITSAQPVFCTSGNPTLTGLSDTTNFWIGMTVEATCLAAGSSTVISKTSSTVTLAANPNVTTNITATFFPWGNGNGTTTFNIPDFRGFAIAGNNNMGGVANSVLTTQFFGATNPNSAGAAGGSQSNILLQTNVPSYNLTVTDPGHSHPGSSGNIQGSGTYLGNIQQVASPGSNNTGVTATQALTIASATTGITVNSGGSGIAFSNIQPTKMSNYIIKTIPDTNSAIASGVTSIQGMTGDIACGAGLTCTGNIISSNASATTLNYRPPFIGGITETQSAYNSQRISVKDFGAKGDGVYVTGNTSITSGTAALQVVGALFTSNDVGKNILVPGAASAGGDLFTTIAVFTDATHVTLGSNAGTTLAAVSTTSFYGTDDTAAFNAAMVAAATSIGSTGFFSSTGKTIYAPAAQYVINGTVNLTGSGVQLYGDDQLGTILTSMKPNNPILVVSSGLYGVKLRSLMFSRYTIATAGGDGLQWSPSGGFSDGIIDNIRSQYSWNGILLGSTAISYATHLRAEFNRNHGILQTDNSVISGSQWTVDGVYVGGNGGDGYSIRVDPSAVVGMGTGNMTNLYSFANAGHGFAAIGNSGCSVNSIRLKNFFFGQDNASEIYLDTYGGGHMIQDGFAELAGTTPTGPGPTILGPKYQTPASHVGNGIEITANNLGSIITGTLISGMQQSGIVTSDTFFTTIGDTWSLNNTGFGLVIADGSKVTITGSYFSSNVAGTKSVTSNASSLQITGSFPSSINTVKAATVEIGGAAAGGNAFAVSGSSIMGNTVISGVESVLTSNAFAFAVGLNGVSNPALQVDTSTALQAAGVKVTGAATGGTVAISTIDSGSNTNLTINAKGTGTIGVGSVSTGAVTITPPVTLASITGSTQCLNVNSSGVISGTGSACGGSGSTPGGSTTQVQYNSSGSFAGAAGFTFDGTSAVTLGVAGTSVGALSLANATSGTVKLSPTTGALGSSVLTLPAVTDTLAGKALANGGTNNSLTASNGGIVYSDASKLNILAGTVTSGQCLLSGSSAAPTWGSCGGGAAVSSVSNSDSTLTISPTTGAVVASLALGHANAWTAAQTIQSASANAFSVGLNGATNPTFNVDASTASSANGLNIKSSAALSGVAVSVISSGFNENLTINGKGAGALFIGNVSTGNVNIGSSGGGVFLPSIGQFAVGSTGNPAFNVNPGTVGTGFNINSAAAGSGLALSAISSGTNESMTLNAKGTGTINIGNVSTGPVQVNSLPITVTVSSGTATMGTSAIASGACATVVTVSATGVATTDVIDVGFNGDPTATTGFVAPNMVSVIPYPTANNINIKECNNTGSSITPSAHTLNWKVRR